MRLAISARRGSRWMRIRTKCLWGCSTPACNTITSGNLAGQHTQGSGWYRLQLLAERPRMKGGWRQLINFSFKSEPVQRWERPLALLVPPRLHLLLLLPQLFVFSCIMTVSTDRFTSNYSPLRLCLHIISHPSVSLLTGSQWSSQGLTSSPIGSSQPQSLPSTFVTLSLAPSFLSYPLFLPPHPPPHTYLTFSLRPPPSSFLSSWLVSEVSAEVQDWCQRATGD